MPEHHHLPGLPDGGRPLDRHRGRTAAGHSFTAPALTRAAADAVARSVRAAAEEARERLPIRRVVELVGGTAGRLADPDTEVGRSARDLLGRELGWPPGLSDRSLQEMGRVWTPEALWGILRSELGDPAVLDEFRPEAESGGAASGRDPAARPGSRRRRASGPPLLLVVNAGNVPGVAVTAALRGLVARSGVLLKSPGEEPGLLPLFGRALTRQSGLLGRAVAATWWPGDSDDPAWDSWTKRSSKVVVYGGESAVRDVRDRTPPISDLVAYGPRLGLGAVLPDAVAGDRGVADALARDVCAYEQRGCVSPRVVYCVGTDDPLPFARRLADALAEETTGRPASRPTGAEATGIRALRARAEVGGYAAGPADGPRVLSPGDGDLSWTVVVGGDPAPVSRALPRVVRVHALDDLAALAAVIRPLEGRIQVLGYAGTHGRRELARLAARNGVARVAPLGKMAWPPADWRHDGRHQILPLLRWTDWEIPPEDHGRPPTR